jgi:predicted RNA binding protein YcfA (HicA-like mRNA interferase family)
MTRIGSNSSSTFFMDAVYFSLKDGSNEAGCVKVRDVIKRLEADGWYLAGVRGDHRHYKHPTKKGIVTVSGHPGKDMPIGTLFSVWKQAQREKEE